MTPSEQRENFLRAARKRMLEASDWTQVADAPLTAAEKTAWKTYRQALRDLPEQDADAMKWVLPARPQ